MVIVSSDGARKLPLLPGNEKLGTSVWQFSLPAIETCPGKSKLCSALCYACKGRYRTGGVAGRLAENDRMRMEDDWTRRVISQIFASRIREVRIHPSGDFDTVAYIDQWIEIVRKSPKTTFWAYTRSWRIPELRARLSVLSRLPNMALWFSCDHETGAPPKLKRVKRAYMSVNDADSPRFKVDMVFRVQRYTKQVRMGGVLVCPVERHAEIKTKTTCQQCQLCFHRRDWLDDYNAKYRAEGATRVATMLPVLG